MEKQEIEAKLNDIERDLADIESRAHIAASNLRSVADEYGRRAPAADFRKVAKHADDIEGMAKVMVRYLKSTRALFERRLVEEFAAEATDEGGAE